MTLSNSRCKCCESGQDWGCYKRKNPVDATENAVFNSSLTPGLITWMPRTAHFSEWTSPSAESTVSSEEAVHRN